MKALRVLWKRLRGTFGRGRADRDFDEEIGMHVELDTERGLREGLSREEARRRALIRLGGVEQVRTAYRERGGLPWLESLARDIRYAFRTLRKHGGVTAAAVLSIGLGVGANATIFSMVSRFVLRPAPVGDPASLVALWITHDGGLCCDEFSKPDFQDVRDQTHSFSGVAAYYGILPASIGGGGEPERVWGQAVTPNFFDVTQVHLVLGRGFLGNDDRAPEVVLSSGLWQRRFGGDKEIVGKGVVLSGRTFTVVGVAQPEFHSVDQMLYSEFWVPLGNASLLSPGLGKENERYFHWLLVVGRLKPGVTTAQAEAELGTVAKRLAQNYPATEKGISFVVCQAGSLQPGSMRRGVYIYLAALTLVVLLVLAIACANVANLLFAQAAARQHDLAVRLALGATRGQLRRELLLESMLLGLGGGAVGAILSLWTTQGLNAFRLPAPVPLDLNVNVDWRVMAYAFALSVVSGLLLGAAPAWAASRPLLASTLRGEESLSRPGRRLRLRSVLVTTQIAMSLVLLSMTGLFLRSLESAASIDIGFRPQGLLVMSIDPRLHGYTAARTVEFLSQLRERAAAQPGVISAVVTDYVPLSIGGRSDGMTAEGVASTVTRPVIADLFMATPGYLETMGIPLVAGRDFGGESATGPKVAIVNRAFAERAFGGENPLGRRVSGGGATYEIIGVAGNMKSRTLGEGVRPVLYRSLRQSVGADPSFVGYTLVIRAVANPAALREAVRRQIHALDPTMAIFNDETMEEHVRSAFFLPRLAATLFGIFGGIGLVLATVGLYGVMSFVVSHRTREIGIRMAMGARRDAVKRLVVRQGMTLAALALALGWPAAWMLAKLVSSFLYGISPHDPATFAVVPAILACVAFVACWIPARRAASINPMDALRAE
ncbi:MAG: ABC transporter permease [Terracidiphilus sp.]|jgi:predicted permease